MSVTPRYTPQPGHLPFDPLRLGLNQPLSWDEILKLPGNNTLKNLYYSNMRWHAMKEYYAVMSQQQANLTAQEQQQMQGLSRPHGGRVDLVDIYADGRDPYEVLLEEGIDPSSGSLEELADDLRAERAIELLYNPEYKETYTLMESLLSAFNRSMDLLTFHAMLRAQVDPAQEEAHRSLKDKLLDDLYRHRPDMAFQNSVVAELFASRLANALMTLGYTAENYAAAFHRSAGETPAYVVDFDKHIAKMSALSNRCRTEVDASNAPALEPSFFPKPKPFEVPAKQDDQSVQEWRYEVALRYIQDMCPHITTLRTTPQEQSNALDDKLTGSSPFKMKPKPEAPEPSAKDKLEYIAKDVLMIDLETLMTRAVYGAMQALGAVGMGTEQAGSEVEMQELQNDEKEKSKGPLDIPNKPRPPGEQ